MNGLFSRSWMLITREAQRPAYPLTPHARDNPSHPYIQQISFGLSVLDLSSSLTSGFCDEMSRFHKCRSRFWGCRPNAMYRIFHSSKCFGQVFDISTTRMTWSKSNRTIQKNFAIHTPIQTITPHTHTHTHLATGELRLRVRRPVHVFVDHLVDLLVLLRARVLAQLQGMGQDP